MKMLATGATSLMLLIVACQSDPTISGTPPPSPSVSPTPSPTTEWPSPTRERLRRNTPPEVVVKGDSTVSLRAWSYCYGNRCISGSPGSDIPDIGESDQALIAFPLSGWRFDATFAPGGKRCGRMQHVRLTESGNGRFTLSPHGFTGTYDVTLSGRGDGGSLAVTFRWTTPVDGPLPVPKARLAVLSGDDGEETSYGIELAVDNLATTPKQVKARVTVTSSEGESITFRPKLTKQNFCRPEGSLYFDRPDDPGVAATQLAGGRPFTYEVTLVLDGKRYRAQARWPQGQIPGNHPSVRLRFSPPLPAVS